MIQKFTPYIFAFTLFVSAMLVFSVQPMLGKMMLPHVGGAPSGWAVTMFFFQTCLLFGYGLAHLFSKLSPLPNIIAIVVLFVIATIFLPLSYQSEISDTISPWIVFVQLTLSTAVPFLALSTISPGLQRLFSFGQHKTANDPYYLYAASNAGSFVGLLAYPIFMEPILGLSEQSFTWMTLFFILFILLFICFAVIFSQRRDLFKLTPLTIQSTAFNKSSPIAWSRRFKWIMLATIPSSLMIGTTMKITTDVASAPMIWVIPLGLYLLTTIIAFGKRKTINTNTNTLSALHLMSVAVLFCVLLLQNNIADLHKNLFLFAGIFLAVFVITAQLLHNLLANDRPDTSKLTEFYLFMALGGAIGGSFNAFIAPLIFNDVYEFPIIFILSLVMNPAFSQKIPATIKKTIAIVLIGLIANMLAHHMLHMTLFLIFTSFFIVMSCVNARLLALTSFIVICYASLFLGHNKIEAKARNFFGVIAITERAAKSSEETQAHRVKAIIHGTTLHGFEALDKDFSYVPSSYYATKGPAGFIYDVLDPITINVLGLGAGQLSCYNGHNNVERETTYYEIDPNVIKFAKENFTLLETCGYKEIILGDARLELEKDTNQYDLIVIDAFSSDSIPVHLITDEAVKLYLSKLKDDGALLFNISNRHLDLKDPLGSIAKTNNIEAWTQYYIPPKENAYDSVSEWVAMTKNTKLLNAMRDAKWQKIETTSRPWTDDYSNLLSTLKVLQPKTNDTKPKE